MRVGERKQDTPDLQLLRPAGRQSREGNVGPAVGGASDLDIPPPDPAGRVTALQRFIDRLLRRQSHGDMLGGVGTRPAVLRFGRGEQAIEDMRAFVGEHRPRARNLDEIYADADGTHGTGRSMNSRRR